MEITPATFDAADKYQLAMHHIGRQLASHRYYGVLPFGTTNITTALNDNIVTLQINTLLAVGQEGQTIHISNDSVTLHLPTIQQDQCFITIRQDGYVELETNGISFDANNFAYEITTLDNIDSHRLAIAKLTKQNLIWQVQKKYVPPIVSLNAHSYMMELLTLSQQNLNNIVQQLPVKHPNTNVTDLKICALELNDFSGPESPEEYHHLLHKAATILSWTHLPESENLPIADLPRFNQNDILNSITPLCMFLSEFSTQIANYTEQVVKVDKPWWDAEL